MIFFYVAFYVCPTTADAPSTPAPPGFLDRSPIVLLSPRNANPVGGSRGVPKSSHSLLLSTACSMIMRMSLSSPHHPAKGQTARYDGQIIVTGRQTERNDSRNEHGGRQLTMRTIPGLCVLLLLRTKGAQAVVNLTAWLRYSAPQ